MPTQPEDPSFGSEFGANEWLVEEMYERYLADPYSVDTSWHEFFADYRAGADKPRSGVSAPKAATPTAAKAAGGSSTNPAAGAAAGDRRGRHQGAGVRPARCRPSPSGATDVDAERRRFGLAGRGGGSGHPRRQADDRAGRGNRSGKYPAGREQLQRHRKDRAGQDHAARGPSRRRPTSRPKPPQSPLRRPVLPSDKAAADEVSVLRGAAARVVTNMDASLTVPTATSVRAVPAKLLADNRIVINNHLRRSRGGKVSFTHLIGYALVKAVTGQPEMNDSFARSTASRPVHARARQPRPGHRPAEERRQPGPRRRGDQGLRGHGLPPVLGARTRTSSARPAPTS